MPDPSEQERLRRLEARIADAKAAHAPKSSTSEEHYSQAQLAWRMVTELVAGLGLGLAIGYGLDALLGTQPFLMVVFVLLGLAAGVKTMLRTATEVTARGAAGPGAGDDTGASTGDGQRGGPDGDRGRKRSDPPDAD